MSVEQQIQELLYEERIQQAEQLCYSGQDMNEHIMILSSLIQIYRMETEHNSKNKVFDYSLNIEELSAHFIKLKLLLRRIEFDLPEQYQKELIVYCAENHVSEYLLGFIVINNIFKQKKVCRQLEQMFSEKGEWFRQVYCYLEGGK